MNEEDLKVTLERFEYFIQITLGKYSEIPLITIMFKSGKSIKNIQPLTNNLNDFQLRSLMAILSFKPDQSFICIPCNDKKYDGILSMRHKDSKSIRQWRHKRGEPLSEGWEGVIR